MSQNYLAGHKDILDSMLLGIPGVTGGKAFGYPAYRVKGMIFAFVGGSGVIIKLPEAQVRQLVAQGPPMHPAEVADGVVWREWVSIQREESAAYEQDMPLFEDALQFVAGL